jgi:hypothetical protein
MTKVVGVNATITLGDETLTIASLHGGAVTTIEWNDVGGVTLAPAPFGVRPKLAILAKGSSTPTFVIVPMGKDAEFAALKAEIVRRVVGAGAPLFQPGDTVLVSNEGRRDSASLRAVHGTHLLVTLPDGTDKWVEREDVSHP